MRLSSGKRKRLEAVSDSRGIIAALAIDQRDALRSLFSAEMKIEKRAVPREQLEQFKSIVVRALSPHASAVLLEPEYGLHAASQRAPSSGLLMAYEVSGYDPDVPSRLPRLLEHWSVRRLVDAGAHCIKVLLYYALSDAPEILERKRRWCFKRCACGTNRRGCPAKRSTRTPACGSSAWARNAPAVTSLSFWKSFPIRRGWMKKVRSSQSASQLFSGVRCKNSPKTAMASMS